MTSPTDSVPYLKMNGLGNEIVVLDLRATKLEVAGPVAMALAERPETQFDQLMVLHDPKTPGTAAFVRIFNTDGSEAGACGNGTRCVADYLSEAFRDNELKLETRPGVLTVWKAGHERYTVDMGRPKFGWQDIPLVEEFRDTRAVELQVGPIDAPIIHSPSVVNVGNPHCVFWVDSLDIIDLGKVGPMLEFHRLFPERANISLAHVTSRTSIDLKVWERGVGLTEACGSAACAAAVCAVRKKFTERKVTVNLPGGPLEIEWRADDHMLMTGPTELESRGLLPAAMFRVG